jgi:hypothetical protein|tara:strand:- start:4185 stop:4292 length:108 start_codon:yes stop_codon:yes gene_type:complete
MEFEYALLKNKFLDLSKLSNWKFCDHINGDIKNNK